MYIINVFHVILYIKIYFARTRLCIVIVVNRRCDVSNVISGVRFSGRPVANGAQNWLRATSIFDYSSPDGDSKYLRSCSILDPAKINGMSINIS